MKKGLCFVLTVFCMGVNVELNAQNQNNRILVAYFSWSGNARVLAG
ncbi:MAG: hypothetical protein LBB98_07300 [Treponema sp.]|jgi:hypothetical protein|nr:hypothetical protein [Treponema sp.]